jgi:hypothetical protein
VTYHNMGKKERAAPVIDVIERPRDSPVGWLNRRMYTMMILSSPPPPKIFDSGDDDEDFWFYEIRILLAAIINTFDFKWKCLYNQWGL